MHAFRRLFITELRNRRNTIIVTLGAAILLHIALTVLILKMPQINLNIVTLINIVIYSILLFIPFLQCFLSWQGEWKQRSIYHLLSLPVSRASLLVTKYMSIILEALLISIVMIAGLWIQLEASGGTLFRTEPLIGFNWSKLVLVMKLLLSATCIVFLCSMSIFLGKSFRKLSFLVTCLSFVVGLFVAIIAFASFPTFVTLLIMSFAYFFASFYILDNKVGIE